MQILSSAVCYNLLLSSPTDMNSKIERSSIFIISAIFPSQMSPMHSTKYLRKTWSLHSIYTNSTYHTGKILSFLKVYQTQTQTSAYTHLTVEQLRGSSSTPSLNAVYSALYSVSWLVEYGTEFPYIRSMSCGTGQEVAFENSTQAVYAYYYPSDSIHKYTREKITTWWTNSSSWIKSIESTGSSCSELSFPILKSTQMKTAFAPISTDSCIVSIKYANVIGSKIPPTIYSTYQISEVKSITEKRTSFQKSIEFKSWSTLTTQYIVPDTIYLYFLQLVYAFNSLSNIRTMSPCPISQMNFSIISIQLSTASHSIILSTTTESIPKSVQSSITIISAPLSCNTPLTSSKEHPCGTSPSQSNWTSPVCKVNKRTLNSPVHSIQPQTSVYEYLITQHAIGISFTQLQIAAYSGFFSVRGVAGYTTDLWRIPFDSYLKSQITLRTSSQNFISLTNGFYPELHPGFSIFIFTEKKRSLESINTDFSTMHKEYASIVRTITHPKSNSSCRTGEPKYLTEGICTSPQSTEPLPCNTMADQQFISNSHSTSSFNYPISITSISALVISRISFSIIPMQILSSAVCYNLLLSSPTDMNSKIERSSIFIISAIFPSQMSPMHSTKYLRKTWSLHSIYTNSTYHTGKILSFLKVYQTQTQTSAYTHLTVEQLRGSSSTPSLNAVYSALYSVSWLVEYGTEFPYIRSMSCGTGQEVAFENSTQAVYAYYYPSDSIHKYTREKITSWWTNSSSWIKSIESTGSSCSELSFPILKSTQMKTAFAPISTDSCIVSIKYANVIGSKIPPTIYSTYQISEVKSIIEKRTSFQKSIEFKSWSILTTQYIAPDTIYLYFLQLVYASNSLSNIRTMSPCPISQMNFSIISIQLSTASHSILLSTTTESIPKSVQSSITIISAPLSCNTPLSSSKEHPCGTSPSQSNWTSPVCKVNKSTLNSPVHSIQSQTSVYEYLITQHAIGISFTQLQIAAYSGFFSVRGVAGYTTDLWRIPFDSYLKSQITLRTSSQNFISLTNGFYPELHPGFSIFIFTEKKRSLESINTDFSTMHKEYASIVRTITHPKSNSSCRTGEPKYLTEGICTSPQSTEPLPCNTMADQQFISNSHSTSSFSYPISITSISALVISRISFSIIPMQILSSAVCYNLLLSSPTDMNSKIERSSIFIISAIFPSQMSPMHSTKYLRKTWSLHSIYTNSTYHTGKILSFLKVYQTQTQTSAYTHLTVEQLRGSSSTPSLNAVYSALYSVSWLVEYGTEFPYIRSMSCGTGQEVAFENSTQAVYAYYYPSDSIHKYTREKITSWWTNSSSWIKSIESTGSSCSELSFPILKSTQMKIDFAPISTDSCIVSIKYANVIGSKIPPTNYSTYQISEVKSITEKRTSFQKSIEFKSWSTLTTQYIVPDTIYLYFLQLVYASNSLSNIRTMSPCPISQMNFSIISIQLSTASHSILLSTTTESIPKSVQSSITIISAPLSCNTPLSSSKEHPCGTSPSQSNWTSPVCKVNKSTLNSPVHSIQSQTSVYEYLITQHAIGISFTQLQIAAYSGFFSVRGVAGYTTDLWRIPFDSYLKSQITLRTSSQNFISLTNGFYPELHPGFSIFIFTEKKRSLESINTDFSTMHKEYASIVRTITHPKSNSSCRTGEPKYLTEGICTSPQSTEPLPCNTMADQQFISNSHSTSSFSYPISITSISALVISRISFSIIPMQILSSAVCYNLLLSSPTDMNSKIERSSIFIISAIFPSQMSPMHSTKYLRKTWSLHSIYTNSTYHTGKILSFLKVYQTQTQTSAYTHLTVEQLRGSSSTPSLNAVYSALYSVSWLVEYGTEFPYIRSMSCGTGQEVAFENSTQAVYAYYYPSDSIHKYTREKITSWWTNSSSWIKSIESTGSSCSELSFPILKSTQMKIDSAPISTDFLHCIHQICERCWLKNSPNKLFNLPNI
ncbi:unnamed protein product [Hermetia illucens]|nr:unnamed protein product [Hermetia illucens]